MIRSIIVYTKKINNYYMLVFIFSLYEINNTLSDMRLIISQCGKNIDDNKKKLFHTYF